MTTESIINNNNNNKVGGNSFVPLLCSPRSAKVRGEVKQVRMWSLNDFDIGRKLGEGRFGKIYLARERLTKCAVVLKCLSKDMIRYHNLTHQLRREIELQEYAGRYETHILRLFAYFWDDVSIFLVLEFADGGNLQNILDNTPQKRLSENKSRHILHSLLYALNFLHERDIIHRDIKPENILLKGKNKEIKLADFSWAVRLNRQDPRHARRFTICGTVDYLSPELLSRQGCTTKSDIWSLGVLAYCIMCGALPFENASSWEICSKITKGEVHYPTYISLEAREFMKGLLCVDEMRRFSCKEALEHPFITKCNNNNNNNNRSQINSLESDLTNAMVNLDFSTNIMGWENTSSFMELPQLSHITSMNISSVQQSLEKQQQEQQQEWNSNNSYRNSSKQPLNSTLPTQNIITTTTTNNNNNNNNFSTAPQSASLSASSFVTVSLSQSTEFTPTRQHHLNTPSYITAQNNDWLPSVSIINAGVNSKSGFDEVTSSSQGASYSQQRLYSSTGEGSNLTMTQNYTRLAPSPSFSVFITGNNNNNNNINNNEIGEGVVDLTVKEMKRTIVTNKNLVEKSEGNEYEENDCAVQLCFDDSLISLSQLTGVSASTVDNN